MRYTVVIKKEANCYSVQAPDLPGCAAAGRTLEEALRAVALTIALHIEVLQEEGLPVPLPTSQCGSVEVCWELNRAGLSSPEQGPFATPA
jgi:predicted RNase H-like HicB family nuclease